MSLRPTGLGPMVREGKFDVVIAAAPGVEVWPSIGVRTLASLCANMKLSVGVFGGDDLRVRGVVPFQGPGGVIIVEDSQARIHRIQARAIIKIKAGSELADPFLGWRSPGFIPLATALRLQRESHAHWDPATVILGTGNRALRFGTELLQSRDCAVYCVEPHAQWGAKRFAGWEVERRRFEMAGGKLIEARPVRLSQKAAMLWELRLQDAQGIRLLEVARVVSAGPFRDWSGLREHPSGSLLFELDQTAGNIQTDDVEGWMIEEERAKSLAVKVVRALATDLGPRREELDKIYRRAKGRLKRYGMHREEPFTPSWHGKWMASGDARKIRSFSGVPRELQKQKPIASVECLEEIACQQCQTVCPTGAIRISPRPDPRPDSGPDSALEKRVLIEERCTGCGLCLKACPSEAISMVEEKDDHSLSRITLAWRGSRPWKEGEFATLLNRRGEALGSARISGIVDDQHASEGVQLVRLDVPSHLLWEARSLRRAKNESAEDEAFFTSVNRSSSSESKVEITLNGEKRLVRDQIPVTVALFETGHNRPEDALFCRDGSCGLCQVTIDGVKKLACQSQTHRGMSLRLESAATQVPDPSLCPCLGVTRENITDRMNQGYLRSPEAVLSVTHVGEGKCRGQVCMGPFQRVLNEQGLETDGWIDWRFPWSEWAPGHS